MKAPRACFRFDSLLNKQVTFYQPAKHLEAVSLDLRVGFLRGGQIVHMRRAGWLQVQSLSPIPHVLFRFSRS